MNLSCMPDIQMHLGKSFVNAAYGVMTQHVGILKFTCVSYTDVHKGQTGFGMI